VRGTHAAGSRRKPGVLCSYAGGRVHDGSRGGWQRPTATTRRWTVFRLDRSVPRWAPPMAMRCSPAAGRAFFWANSRSGGTLPAAWPGIAPGERAEAGSRAAGHMLPGIRHPASGVRRPASGMRSIPYYVHARALACRCCVSSASGGGQAGGQRPHAFRRPACARSRTTCTQARQCLPGRARWRRLGRIRFAVDGRGAGLLSPRSRSCRLNDAARMRGSQVARQPSALRMRPARTPERRRSEEGDVVRAGPMAAARVSQRVPARDPARRAPRVGGWARPRRRSRMPRTAMVAATTAPRIAAAGRRISARS